MIRLMMITLIDKVVLMKSGVTRTTKAKLEMMNLLPRSTVASFADSAVMAVLPSSPFSPIASFVVSGNSLLYQTTQ